MSRDKEQRAAGAEEKKPKAHAKDAHPKKKGRRAASGKEAGKKKGEDTKDLQDRLLRLQADFDNFRKRTLREKNDLYRRANEDLITELLPVLDHVDIALASLASHDPADPAIQGFKLVAEQLTTVLKKFGVSPIDAEGVEFDHNVHEAISHLPSEDVPENVVMAQVRRGYKLGDNLLRAAQAVVSSGPADEKKSDQETVCGDQD